MRYSAGHIVVGLYIEFTQELKLFDITIVNERIAGIILYKNRINCSESCASVIRNRS